MSCAPGASGATCRRLRHFRRGRRSMAISALSWRRGVGDHPPLLCRHAARDRRAGGQPDRRHHRHPERQDHGKGGPRGYDAAKKVKGRKRHIAVDTSGFLLGVLVHAADIQDADSAWELLRRIKHLYCWLKAVFADSIYDRARRPARLLSARPDADHRPPHRRHHRLRRAAPQVGRRKNTRLARPMAAPVQGLRGTARGLRGHGHPRHDSARAHAPPPLLCLPTPRNPKRATLHVGPMSCTVS